MINSNLLKSAMVKNNYTIKSLAKDINMSSVSLNYKINNKREFKSSEIKSLIRVLKLTMYETNDIFFN